MNLSELKEEAGLGSWHFQCDNPNFIGWSVVSFYGIAAICCAIAAVRARSGCIGDGGTLRTDRRAGIWWALTSVLVFLGFNKQLNFQTLMIVIMRHVADVGGWWDNRRAAQLAFCIVFGIGVCLLLVWLASRHREFFRTNPMTFWGVFVLGVFLALRAATINHADALMRINLRDKEWAWVLEISGSSLIGLGAVKQPSHRCLE